MDSGIPVWLLLLAALYFMVGYGLSVAAHGAPNEVVALTPYIGGVVSLGCFVYFFGLRREEVWSGFLVVLAMSWFLLVGTYLLVTALARFAEQRKR